MDEQLSFEETLYERERELLLITSTLGGILNRLHYLRTRITATLGMSKSKRQLGALRYCNIAATGALSWLATLQYHLDKELADMSGMDCREEDWYRRALDSDIFIEDARTTPYGIYQEYILIYKKIQGLFQAHTELLANITGSRLLINEFYKDMQVIGEELEGIL